MELFVLISIFIFGLAVGSFLNCLIYRLDKKESILKGRSFCPCCRHKLNCWDLIPVLSFLFLKGKCRYCKKKISWQYPLVELATGALFVLSFWFSVNYLSFFYLIVVSCFLIIIFVYDLKKFLILDKVIYPAIAIAFLYNLIDVNYLINSALLAAVGATLFFLVIFLISRGKWLGFGDVKLAFFLGLLVGFPNILILLFLSFLIGAIIGTGIIICKKGTLKSEVPFAPFLVTGTLITLFWGSLILDWYLKFVFY